MSEISTIQSFRSQAIAPAVTASAEPSHETTAPQTALSPAASLRNFVARAMNDARQAIESASHFTLAPNKA